MYDILVKELALKLPWTDPNPIDIPSGVGKFPEGTTTLGSIITSMSTVAIYIGGFMMFIWLVIGVFQYIIAEGNKENLAKAKAKIRWAIIGFVILIMAFFVSEAFQGYVQPQIVPIKTLTSPETGPASACAVQGGIWDSKAGTCQFPFEN